MAIKNYVKQNAGTIRTVDPDFTNYSDLEPIGNAIGDAKISSSSGNSVIANLPCP
jgi:hypothetical protein